MTKQSLEKSKIIEKILNNKAISDEEERIITDAIIKARSYFQDCQVLRYLRKMRNQKCLEEIAERAAMVGTRIRAVRYIKDQTALEKIASHNDNPSTRITAIERLNDVDFLTKMYQEEKDQKVKKALWKILASDESTIPTLSLDDITKLNKNDLNVALSTISNKAELKRLALKRNPSKRVAKEIPKIESATLLKFIIAHKSVKSSNIKEWTNMTINLAESDLEIAKRIFLDKKVYTYNDVLKIKDENKLFDIAMETTSENILFHCVSKIKNQHLLEKIINNTKNSFIRNYAKDRLKGIKISETLKNKKEKNEQKESKK